MTVLRALRTGWLVILLAAVAGGVGGAVSLHQQTPVYRSVVQLLVAVRGATTPDDAARNRSFAVTRAFGLAQIALTRPALADAEAQAGRHSAAAVALGVADLSDPFLRLEVTDPDPATARALATALVTSLPRTAAALGVQTRPGVSLEVVAPASPAVLAAPLAWRYLLAGIAAGLGVGLALALLREVLGVGPADPEQTAELVGWPLLATVPDEPGRAPWLAAPGSARAEAHRQVLTAAVHGSPRGVRSIAVVGAGAGDGASSLTANLVALARAGGHDAVAVDHTVTPAQLAELRTTGTQDLLLVDAGRLLPHPGRPELLTGVDVVVVVVTWRRRHRVRDAARAARRLDAAVAGLVVNRGPVDPQARPRRDGPVTTTVPIAALPPQLPVTPRAGEACEVCVATPSDTGVYCLDSTVRCRSHHPRRPGCQEVSRVASTTPS